MSYRPARLGVENFSGIRGRPHSAPSNAYEGRWRWWYDAVADWMIAHPGGKLTDCAAYLGKHPNTISLIVNTDMFKEYLARRRAEWRERHDHAMVSKMYEVAGASLDLVLDKIKKKGDQIPMDIAVETMTSTLDRLGYGPNRGPSVAVQVNNTDNSAVVNISPVSAAALEEAREAMRVSQEHRRSFSNVIEHQPAGVEAAVEVEPQSDEDEDGPFTISSE